MKLVIMTRPTFFVEEDKIIDALFNEGLDDLHLYKPDSSPVYLERLLSLLPEDEYKRMTVHNHYYLKNEFKLGGIHIDDPLAEKPDGYKGNITRTCTDLSQLKALKKKSKYVFLKNIFDSVTDERETASFSTSELSDASRKGLIDKHVYAMGGMTLDRVKIVKEMGFGGVVICGDLWNRFDIHQGADFRQVLSYFNQLRQAVK